MRENRSQRKIAFRHGKFLKKKGEKKRQASNLNGKVRQKICIRQMWKSTHNYSSIGTKIKGRKPKYFKAKDNFRKGILEINKLEVEGRDDNQSLRICFVQQ